VAEEDRPVYCTQCGSITQVGDKFCRSCGTRIPPNVPDAMAARESSALVSPPPGATARRGRGPVALIAAFGTLAILVLAIVGGMAFSREPEYEVTHRRDISELLQSVSRNDYGDTGALDEEGTALHLQVEVGEEDAIPSVEEQIPSDFPTYKCIAVDYYVRGRAQPVERSYIGGQSCGDDIEALEWFVGPLSK